MHILLVEDDAECRQFLAMNFEADGMTVTQCIDAEQALSIIKSSSIDIVMSDVNLPCMDGLALLEQIQKISDIPVIIITGYGSVGSAVKALKLGATDYLVKPFEDTSRISRIVAKAVEHHRLTTHNKDLIKKLARAERLEYIGNLAGGVAHDLNNMLAPMLGLPDVMQGDLNKCTNCCKIAEQLRNDLDIMKESIQRAVIMVRDLLTFSRRNVCELSPQNINSIVKACISSQEFIEMSSTNHDVKTETDLAPNLPNIAASAPHIIRVICNLARNGIEAANQLHSNDPDIKPKLTIKTSSVILDKPKIAYEIIPPACYVVLAVTDNGAGIEPENTNKIFEPFFTQKKQTRSSGSGLGLAVVHGVAKDHHGFLDVNSQLGKGSTFSVYFPATTEPSSLVSDQIKNETYIGGNESILVIDDDIHFRMLAERFLKTLGYQVTLARDGHDAVNMAKKFTQDSSPFFELMLINMTMEDGFDGLDTLRLIKALYPKVKAIISSGHAINSRIQDAIDIGAGWLPKPYRIGDLAKSLRKQLDIPNPSLN